ncbi:DEKNAAC104267 [Brettanomyces naardenensis]|uniref:DEKNAAC104267 n=1 Tax=Brettanomyces naardenensis TaxID=13370 RepID=A0A448YPW9_BRENA|nr:DEKNAAC104267 [Brettanomyces naardenensis]
MVAKTKNTGPSASGGASGSRKSTGGSHNNHNTNNSNSHSSGSSNSRDRNKYRYRIEIQQMMFVSGETNDPPESTTELIEDIVRDQVVELMLQAQKTANARGQRAISPEDVIFMIRHDRAKVNRLRTYLSWKDVRKNAKDQENGEIGATGNDLMDDGAGGGNTGNGGRSGDAANSGTASGGPETRAMTVKQKKSLRLPWELEFMFNEQPLVTTEDAQDDVDEDEREALLAEMKRLKQNDERTKHMTQKEYVHWSDCRQASFTFRKSKRFREWCGMSQIAESRPNDDVIDILGFLTFELVCSITEEALKIKQAGNGNSATHERKSKRRKYLFDEPDDDSMPIEAVHIQEAWRHLQKATTSAKALFNFRGGRLKGKVNMI